MLLKLTLVPVREDRERYSSIVSYEEANPGALPERILNLVGANPAAVGLLNAVRRTREWVQDARGQWRFIVTRVSRIRVPGRLGREWPRHMADRPAPEPEELRRARIRAMRAAIHVDRMKGTEEPDWDRALKLAASSPPKGSEDFCEAQVSEIVPVVGALVKSAT